MHPIIFEGKMDSIAVEDGGAAVIADTDWKVTGGDDKVFVRLQSWDEDICNHPDFNRENSKHERFKLGHPTMQKLIGKKVRITVEIVED